MTTVSLKVGIYCDIIQVSESEHSDRRIGYGTQRSVLYKKEYPGNVLRQ